MMKAFLSAMTLLIPLLGYAQPECDYNLKISNATVLLTEVTQVIQQNYSVERGANSPAGRCESYRLFFSKGQANSYQRAAFASGQGVKYNLHPQLNMSSILKEFGDALSSNEFIQASAPERQTVYTGSFFLSVPGLPSQGTPSPGVYSDNVQVSIYGFNPNSGNYTFESVTNLTVTLVVTNKLQISIVEEGAPFNPSSTNKVLDYGVLSQYQEMGADIMVVSNSPYQLRIASPNGGALKHTTSPDKITYQMRVNGNLVGLNGSESVPVTIGGSSSATPAAGDRFNVRAKIMETTESKLSGTYQDVITITAIAN